MSLHVGFDVSQTGSGKAGCGFFAYALANALTASGAHNRYAFYPDFGDFWFDHRMPLRNPFDSRCSSYGPRHLTREGAAAFWNAPGLEAALGSPDVVHSNNFWCPLQLSSSRLVYTLHDMAFLVEPAWSTEANRLGCFDGVFRAACVADWVVAVSQASRGHFLHVFPHFPPERVRVVHQCSRFPDDAGDARPAALAGVAPGRFWLSVGTIEPRKNQRLLASAYAAYIADGGEPMPLVLAGGEGWRMEGFARYLEELGLGGKVMCTGYVSDEELVWLYRNCFANLYPSLFEGFGLPVLEGMQFGAASLCSGTTSMPEVAGEAAWLLDPCDGPAWTAAMLRLAGDEAARTALRARARERARRFDWRASAGELLALYDEAVASPKRRTPCRAP